MKKFFSAIILLLVLSQASAQDIPKWKIGELEAFIKNSDKPTIVNFWATFCKPCIEEIPYFEKLVKKYEKEGVQLLLVSLDLEEMYPKKIAAFTKKFKFSSPVVFLDETNADIFCPAIDEKWSGAIPASLFINNKTGYRNFYEDQLSEAALDKEIKMMIAAETK